MPELPDITVYRDALHERLVGSTIETLRIVNPFVLRSVEPAPEAFVGKRIVAVTRLGKRLVLQAESELAAVIHLMIAGRLHWIDAIATGRAARPPGPKQTLFALTTDCGTLYLTEAGRKRRASLMLVSSEAELAANDPGGLEVLDCTKADFRERLRRQNHTLKRALTDPKILSGIGNAYSDEILHRARLSPFRQIKEMDDDALDALLVAIRSTLSDWIDRLTLATRATGGFPCKVTAFRDDMAAHGRYGLPCPDCGHPIQRIVHGQHETNYCAHCQTGGRILKDRALSRLLKDSFPKRLED